MKSSAGAKDFPVCLYIEVFLYSFTTTTSKKKKFNLGLRESHVASTHFTPERCKCFSSSHFKKEKKNTHVEKTEILICNVFKAVCLK